MSKLIRDLIPADMRANGFNPEIKLVWGSVKFQFLLQKLVEEAGEAASDDGSIEELADVYGVLRAIAKAKGISMEQIAWKDDEKTARRGGFDQGYLWINSGDASEDAERARKAYRAAESQEVNV